jgi:hypothetical protein
VGAEEVTYGNYTDEACKTPEAKQATRLRALDLVRDHSCNLWSPSKNALRYDWLELAGHRAPMLNLLMSEGVLGSSRFIGVDTDKATIEDCQSHYGSGDHAEWVHGDMRRVLTLKKHAELRERVGVLVYDSHDGLHNQNLARNLRPLFTFAQEQRDRLGEFLLILNVTAAERNTTDSDRKRYSDLLSDQVGYPVDVDHQYRSKVTPMIWTALRYNF